jgi:mannose-6-phosphate isomerase-like protein (cupin superfamily)
MSIAPGAPFELRDAALSGGAMASIARLGEYAADRLTVRGTWASGDADRHGHSLYVHAGACTLRLVESDAPPVELSAGDVCDVPGASRYALVSREATLFRVHAMGAPETGSEHRAPVKRAPYDRFERYWGMIETIANGRGYCAKRMIFEAGRCNSLHFHCRKMETFWVAEGALRVRLRDRFAEDHEVTVAAGGALHVPPGLMHQLEGAERTVLFESSSSTPDDDSDSFRVEKGRGFVMTAGSHPHIGSDVRS